MSYDLLTLHIEDRLALVRLNRPSARNALSRALMLELTACARELAERTDIDVVILTGDERCFSAGADLKDANAWPTIRSPRWSGAPSPAPASGSARPGRKCRRSPSRPSRGFAVGGGLALSLACDWRVAAEDAFVSLPEIALGIPLTWGTIPRLVNLLGRPRPSA